MEKEDEPRSTERRLTYVAISMTFFALAITIGSFAGRLDLTPLQAVFLAFAAMRGGRLISFDRVASTYRSFFTRTVPDGSGAGDTVEAKGEGWRRAIGELVSCPICSGTWAATAMVYGAILFPSIAWNLIYILGSIGAGEVLHSIVEVNCWTGQVRRMEAGRMEQERAKQLRTPVPEPGYHFQYRREYDPIEK